MLVLRQMRKSGKNLNILVAHFTRETLADWSMSYLKQMHVQARIYHATFHSDLAGR
jgi:hypothetical protein